MARNSLGRFTRRATPRVTFGTRQAVARRRLGRHDPLVGTEVSGVISGEPIILGEQQTSGGGGEIESTRTKSKTG